MQRGGFPGGGMPGGGMPGNMQKLMKEAQRMQREMEQRQAELETKSYEAASGGGAVKVTMTGKFQLTGVAIQPAAVDPADVEMLQDLVLAAVNEVLRRVREDQEQSYQSMTGGLKLPGMP